MIFQKTILALFFIAFAINILCGQKKQVFENDLYGTWTAKIDDEKGYTFDIKYTFTSDKKGYTDFVYKDTTVKNVVYLAF